MVPRVRAAFVLGAGLGTRLRPLTNVIPKPLLPIFGKRLITFALDHLIASGVERFVINTHHLSDQFTDFFSNDSYRGKEVVLVHEPVLLETGGGIRNVAGFFEHEPFLVYSGDVLTDINLGALIDFHFRSGSQVTLALRHTGLSTDLSFAAELNRVVDVRGQLGSGFPGNVDFANVSLWNPDMIRKIPPDRKVSFIPILAEAIRDGARIGGVILDEQEWFNIGSRQEYLGIHRTVVTSGWRPTYLTEASWPTTIADSAVVSQGVEIAGACWIGSECRIEPRAFLQDVVVWPRSIIRSDAHLSECVVAGAEVGPGTFCRTDFV
jgi:NDP-sugar pyrophosphorylase family protein